jgi:hypothetical protein
MADMNKIGLNSPMFMTSIMNNNKDDVEIIVRVKKGDRNAAYTHPLPYL